MRVWLLTLATLCLSACTSLSVPPPANLTQHTLDALPVILPAPTRRMAVLRIGTLQARPGYDTSRMAYTRRPHELEYFAVNRWVAPPTRQLESLLLTTLEQTAAFRAVVPAASTLADDLQLEVELIQLHQDFTERPSRLVLSLRAQLVDLHANRALAARRFDETETAVSDDARGGVDAANRAVQRVLGRLAEFCITESTGR